MNFSKIILFFVLAFSIFFIPIFAQDKILRFKQLTIEEGLPQNTVHGIIKDKYGFMWFGTLNGLCKYDGYKITNYYTDANNPNTIINNRIKYLFKDTLGDIWIASMDVSEICRYNYETDDFTRFLSDSVPKYIADTLSSTYNSICIQINTPDYSWYTKRWQPNADNWYLNQVNLKNGNHTIYKDSQTETWSINDKLINYIYLDDNDILWAGTYSGGVNLSDTRAKPFNRFYNSTDVKFYIIDNFTRAICQDQEGNLWIGTYKNGITHINRKDNIYNYFTNTQNKNSLIDNSIRKIFCDSHGYICIGTKAGLDRYDPKGKKFVHYSTKYNKGIPNDWVFAITEDKTENIWIGTFKGIAKYDKENDRFFSYEPDSTLNHQSVRALLVDKNNNLWVGTEGGGITLLQRKEKGIFKEKLSRFHFKFSNSDINVNRVYALTEDENGIIWVATSGGLVRFDPGNRNFRIISTKDGLLSDAIVGILSDQCGYIWFSHKRGLSKINNITFEIRNYTLNDGLQSLEFSEDAYYRNNKTGEMFFGGIGGFNTFFPDSIKDNPYPPRIVITELKIFNNAVKINEPVNKQIILTKSITLTDQISLSHSNRTFTIEFAGLHYTNPNDNKYKYMLEGFDKDWISTDASKRFAVYSNLDPQTYFFKVKAANCDGVWNESPAILKIIVLPAWWQTWWFKLTVSILIIGLVLLGYYLRLAYYRNQHKKLTAIVQERTRDLENSNHFIKKQSEELREHGENLKKINELLLEKQKQIILQSEQLMDNNEKILMSNKTKDKLFSIIGHDLRNPFNVTLGFSELLLKNLSSFSKEKIQTILQYIYNASKTGNNLLENLLQWSRTQSGRIFFEPVSLNLYALVEESVSLLEGEAKRKKIKVNNQVDQTILIDADENMTKTVLRNLVSNAIKFTYENGLVSIEALLIGSFIEISVNDTGVGMTDETMHSLFNLETNISKKGTTDEVGTGLGLFLCKEFVIRQGGNIWAESEIGKGSTFKFTLPKS